MGADTKIEWCHHTFNPWWGCVKVSPGCAHCYAEAFDRRTHGTAPHLDAKGNVREPHWGKDAPRRFFGDAHWREPLKWDRAAKKQQECPHHSSTGPDDNDRCDGCDARIITTPVPGARPAGLVRRKTERPRVFCASMADVFEDRDDLVEPRARLLHLIDATPALDWLLLTKRPENITDLSLGCPGGRYGPGLGRNVWLGTTVEDQERADERIPHLLAVPAAVRFLSVEPLLGPARLALDGIHWVIVGGESGPGARPCDVRWIRDVVRQCQEAGVAVFVKQLGANVEDRNDAGFDGSSPDAWPVEIEEAGRVEHIEEGYQGAPVRVRLKDPKGGDPSEWPSDLRVRQLPTPPHGEGGGASRVAPKGGA